MILRHLQSWRCSCNSFCLYRGRSPSFLLKMPLKPKCNIQSVVVSHIFALMVELCSSERRLQKLRTFYLLTKHQNKSSDRTITRLSPKKQQQSSPRSRHWAKSWKALVRVPQSTAACRDIISRERGGAWPCQPEPWGAVRRWPLTSSQETPPSWCRPGWRCWGSTGWPSSLSAHTPRVTQTLAHYLTHKLTHTHRLRHYMQSEAVK